MCTFSSAIETTAVSRSTVEYTATVRTPISRHVRATRSAISPRLAIKILLNTIAHPAVGLGHGRKLHQRFAVFDRLAVHFQDLDDPPDSRSLHRQHQLHRLDNGNLLPG